MQNPETNKLEMLQEARIEGECKLFRQDGSLVPQNAIIFRIGEEVVLKGYTYKIAYIGESALLLEPIGLPKVDGPTPTRAARKEQASIKRKIQKMEHGKHR